MYIKISMTTFYKYFLSVVCFVLFLPGFILAQGSGGGTGNTGGGGSGNTGGDGTGNTGGISVKLQNPLRMDSLEELLIAILNLIMVLMVPVMVFFIIFAGFKYVTARGNPNTIGEATKALTYAVIGAVIILGAVAISQMIKSTVDEFRVDTAASIYTDTPKLS